MDFTVTLTAGATQSYAGADAHYTVDEESGALTVTLGTKRWRNSPAAWVVVEDDFGGHGVLGRL